MKAQRGLEAIARAALAVAGEASTLSELAGEITGLIGAGLPHDGYRFHLHGGLDPVVGAVMLGFDQHYYSPQAVFDLAARHCTASGRYPLSPSGDEGRRPRPSGFAGGPEDRRLEPVQLNPFAALIGGARRSIGAFSSVSPKDSRTEQLHEIMFTEGYGSDLRIGVTMRGRMWGVITLLRERGARPFTADDLAHAERLSDVLAEVLRRFTTGIPLRTARGSVPGTVIFDRTDRVRAATPAGRAWLRDLVNNPGRDGSDPETPLLGPVVAARIGLPPVITAVPTSRGWASVHAQPLDEAQTGDIAVTIQPASSAEMLSALAACRGITPREKAVIGQTLNGLSAKQIARRLGMSPYTVHDHLKAIYPKIGVASRDELVAVLTQ